MGRVGWGGWGEVGWVGLESGCVCVGGWAGGVHRLDIFVVYLFYICYKFVIYIYIYTRVNVHIYIYIYIPFILYICITVYET